jgi:hypothetical protein
VDRRKIDGENAAGLDSCGAASGGDGFGRRSGRLLDGGLSGHPTRIGCAGDVRKVRYVTAPLKIADQIG